MGQAGMEENIPVINPSNGETRKKENKKEFPPVFLPEECIKKEKNEKNTCKNNMEQRENKKKRNTQPFPFLLDKKIKCGKGEEECKKQAISKTKGINKWGGKDQEEQAEIHENFILAKMPKNHAKKKKTQNTKDKGKNFYENGRSDIQDKRGAPLIGGKSPPKTERIVPGGIFCQPVKKERFTSHPRTL